MPYSEQLHSNKDGDYWRNGGLVYQGPGTVGAVRPVEGTTTVTSSRANLYDPHFLQYCQSCVNKKVHVREQLPYLDMADSRGDDGCCGRFGRCCLAVPAGSLSCWVLLAIGMSACCGALYVAAYRTREWLEKPETFLQYAEAISMSILGGMIFIGIVFLFVSTLVSSPTNKTLFNTSKKNSCGQVLNIITIFFIFLMDMVWVVCTVVLAIPVMYFILLHILYKDMGIESINLKNYALSSEDKIFQGKSLDSFYSEGKDVFICYLISMAGAFLVVISLTGFLLCAAANTVYMKEARYSVLNAYRHDVNTSKISIVDTRM